MNDEVDSALRLQRKARLRAKAQQQAKGELTRRHKEEYKTLYSEAKAKLEEEE